MDLKVVEGFRSIFRDMVNIGKGVDQQPIELDDERLESATTMQHVFDIVMKGGAVCATPIIYLQRVVGFLRKYECKASIESIQSQLWATMSRKRGCGDKWLLFVRASFLDDHELCCRIISDYGDVVWADKKSSDTVETWGDDAPGSYIFDPSAMSQAWLRFLPEDTVWALLRASSKATFNKPTAGSSKMPAGMQAMGQEYKRLMQLRGEF